MLTGLRNWAVWPNYEVVEFQDSVSDFSIHRLCSLFSYTLPCPSYYSNFRHRYHTSSYSHLGISHIRSRVSIYHTRSISHLGVSSFFPRMPNSQPALPLLSSSYCLPIYPLIILFLAFCEYARLALSCFYDESWSHQASFLFPPPSYHVSLLHASNIKLSATHWTKVAWRLYM